MNRAALLVVPLLLLPTAATAATRVSSNSSCPSSDAISVRLLGLLSEGGPERAEAKVRSDGQMLRIELATPGEATQQRSIPLAGDCDERAEMAAMIIASWLDAMPVGTVKAPGIPPRERWQPSSSGGKLDPDDPYWEPTRTSGRTLLGAGGFGSVDKQGGTGGLSLVANLPQMIEDFGLLAEASLGYRRELTVGAGTARYWRPMLALQASAGVYHRGWNARVVAGPALAVLTVSGSGYQTDLSGTTVLWGIDFGLTVVRPWHGNELWLMVGGVGWPQDRHIRSLPDVTGSAVALPSWEGRVTVGLSWQAAELWK